MCRTPPRSFAGRGSKQANREPLKEIFDAYLCESFARGFVNSHALRSTQVAGEQRDMWEWMVEAAQTPALHWAVIAAVVLA